MAREETANKHAYLIIAHDKFEQLRMLCEMLDFPQHDIYIHIDACASDFDADTVRGCTKFSPITFVDRIEVNWGGYSQIQAELNLLEAAKASHTDYGYYHLLSGADLPLRPARELWEYFDGNAGTEFVHYCTNDFTANPPVQERAKVYHLFQERIKRSGKIVTTVERAVVAVQNLLRVNRYRSAGIEKIYCGSNWFSITDRLAEHVLAHKSWIQRTFHCGCCVDECFLQTLMIGSEFEDKLYMPVGSDDCRANMRYIDWKRGNPYVFRAEDYNELVSSQCLFARKFDENISREICQMLYAHCMKTENIDFYETATEEKGALYAK